VQVKGRQAAIDVYEAIGWQSNREDGEPVGEVNVGRDSLSRTGLCLPHWLSHRHELSLRTVRRSNCESDRSTCWSPAPTLLGRSPGGPMSVSSGGGGSKPMWMDSSHAGAAIASSRGCSPTVAATPSRTPRDFMNKDSGNFHFSPGGGTPLTVLSFMEDQVCWADREMATTYEEALEAYHDGNFEEAEKICKVLLSSRPNDTATLKLLQKATQSRGSDAKPGATVMLQKC